MDAIQSQPTRGTDEANTTKDAPSIASNRLSTEVTTLLSNLKALGYQQQLFDGCLNSLDDSQSHAGFLAGKVLQRLGIRNFLHNNLESYLGGAYASQLSTHANNLKPENRTVSIPKYSMRWSDATQKEITITDNFSGREATLTTDPEPTPHELAAFKRFREAGSTIALPDTVSASESISFCPSRHERPFNLPADVRSSLSITSDSVSFGSKDQTTSSVHLNLESVLNGRDPISVNGHLTGLHFGFSSAPRDLPQPERDQYSNTFIYEYRTNAAKPDEGVITVEIIPDPVKSHTNDGQKIDLTLLKSKFREFENSPDTLTFLTSPPQSREYKNYQIVNQLSKRESALVTPELMDLVVEQSNRLHDVFGVNGVIKEFRLIDAGLLGGSSHVNRHIPGVIHLIDTRLRDPEALERTARHEGIHVIDLQLGLSDSRTFASTLKYIQNECPSLLEKIAATGEHPWSNSAELLESLVTKVLDFRALKVEDFSKLERDTFCQALRDLSITLRAKSPDAALLNTIEGVLNSPRWHGQN